MTTATDKWQQFLDANNKSNETIKTPRMTPEDTLTAECYKAFIDKYPYLHKAFWHTANENPYGGKAGGKRQRMGVVAGVPDFTLRLPIFINGGWIHGLDIELKCGRNTQQDSQREYEEFATAAGYCYRIIKSKETFLELVDKYLSYVDPDVMASFQRIYQKWEEAKDGKEEARKVRRQKREINELASALGIDPSRIHP